MLHYGSGNDMLNAPNMALKKSAGIRQEVGRNFEQISHAALSPQDSCNRAPRSSVKIHPFISNGYDFVYDVEVGRRAMHDLSDNQHGLLATIGVIHLLATKDCDIVDR